MPISWRSQFLDRVVRGLAIWAAALIVLSMWAGPAEGLDPHRTLTQSLIRKWQVQQGLPQPTILVIRQTSDRYLWLGTPKGLVRFDGVRFTTIQDLPGVPLEHFWIDDLCEDAGHNLWIATDGNGLVRLGRDGTARAYTRADGLPSDNMYCVLSDRRGDVWAGTDAGLARRAADGPEAFELVPAVAAETTRAICESADGTLWVGSDSGLNVWDGSQFTARELPTLPESATVRALAAVPGGAVWVGTTAGLWRLNRHEWRRFSTADGLADDSVLCLAVAHEGSIWVGTKDGLSRVQGDEIESFQARDGLSQSTVYTLCEDHEGSLWVGTKYGLNQFADRRTIPFTASEGLPSNDTGPVFQDRAGTIWVGTLGAGLARFDGRQFSVAATSEQGMPSDTVLSLADGDDRDLWIGTDRGLCRLADGRVAETYGVQQGMPSDVVRCLCRDRAGTLWAGTSAGLVALRDGICERLEGDAGAAREPIAAIVDNGGLFLLTAAENGALYRLQDGQWREFADGDAAVRGVDAFYEDADGLLWMGTRGGGLRLLDGRRTVLFSIKDGLYDDDIFGIVADDEDRLWMACSKGIFYVRRRELRDFADGAAVRVTSTPFSPTDALRTIECQHGVQPAVWKMSDGRVWFSTIRGLLVIDSRYLQRKLPPPSVLIEEVKINGQHENPERDYTLPPGRTNLDFRYTALSYVSPTRTTFRYLLEGFDKEWVDAGTRREAFYTNLPPGDYRFRVSAHTVDGIMSEAQSPVTFTIQPHLYQRSWFMPSAVGLAVLCGWAAYRLRVGRIKAQLRAVLAERSRIARELHDTLMQGFSGITMEMQALAARLPPSAEREALDEIIHDAGFCLREARRSVAGLRSPRGEESDLAAVIAQAARQITETHDIRLQFRLERSPQGLKPDVEYNLLRIVQEAVTNAVKHAGCRSIEVGLDGSAEALVLWVKDDGSGLTDGNGEQGQAGHYGLIGMKERANQIGAILRIVGEPAGGTTVELRLPLPPDGSASEVGGPAQSKTAAERA